MRTDGRIVARRSQPDEAHAQMVRIQARELSVCFHRFRNITIGVGDSEMICCTRDKPGKARDF